MPRRQPASSWASWASGANFGPMDTVYAPGIRGEGRAAPGGTRMRHETKTVTMVEAAAASTAQ